MPITLRLASDSSIPIEFDGLTPKAIRELTLADIERLPVTQGNSTVPLAELFAVRGQPGSDMIVCEGDMRSVHGLGVRLTEGTFVVEGSLGRHTGAEMVGGRIDVRGDASDWVGAEMRGGVITVEGNVQNGAGGAYRGSRYGMAGGTLFIRGHAGDEVGRSMRRGLVVIGGNCGGAVGYDMRAGSILVGGDCGQWPGAGMHRGTLIVLGSTPPLLPSFQRGGRHRPEFLPLLFRSFERFGYAVKPELACAEFDLFHGDLLSLGRGEILVRHTPD